MFRGGREAAFLKPSRSRTPLGRHCSSESWGRERLGHERQNEGKTDRIRDRKPERQRGKEIERETETETERIRETERHR